MLWKTPSLFILTMFIAASCSLYRSEGRKEFETRSTESGTILQSRSIQSESASRSTRHQILRKHTSKSVCTSVNSVDFWLASQFSPETHELVFSSDKTEVWKSIRVNHGMINYAVIVNEQIEFEICNLSFNNEEDAQVFLEEFLKHE
ncbi:MAG: hypothetical protein V4736_00390 [Bdellovibrionota bacterium]